MKNFKINTNQQPLSDADIARGKDFGQVVKNYKAMKTSFFKAPKFWFGASSVLVATVAAVLVFNTFKTPDALPQRPSAFINPPVASADIKNETYVLNAQTDSTIIHPSGTRIHVPANAFLDKDGKVAQGAVELHYREFKDPMDVFLAGIPMTYDSGGQQYHFETAGMMEIRATQNGLGLKPNPASPIKVDLVSDNNEDRFNTYYLDTTEKKWKYLAQSNYNAPSDSVTPFMGNSPVPAKVTDAKVQKALAADSQSLKNIDREIAAMQKQKPVAPVKAETGKQRFSIKVDEKEFPEIAVYKGVKFQVDDANYNPEKAKITWSDISLERIAGSSKYRITFINPDEKYQVVAVPVFGDKDYATANVLYDQKFNEYQAALDKKKADAAKLKADLMAKVKAQDEAMAKFYAEREAQEKLYVSRLQQTSLIYRSFTVSDFGYYNSDHPCTLPPGNNVVKLVLVDATTKKPLIAQQCYLVEKERNVLFQYDYNSLGKFRYNTSRHNGLYVILDDQQIAVAKYNDFEQAKKEGGELVVEVSPMDRSLKTENEVRQYLQM